MTNGYHYVENCADCKRLISQCRCPSRDKAVRVGLCASCKKKREASAASPHALDSEGIEDL